MKGRKQSLEALLSDESFQRWLSGKSSEKEAKEWRTWQNQAPTNRALCQEAARIWRAMQFKTAPLPDIEAELEYLFAKLRLPAERPATVLSLESRRPYRRTPAHSRDSWLRFGIMALAASLFLALVWHFNFFSRSHTRTPYNTVTTEYGQRVRITLPEGTKIILNANSTLKYPADWTTDAVRHFELTGEAYFDVTPLTQGKGPKFVVHTVDGIIRVVGTRFAVYERGRGTRVVVEEGKVVVSSADTSALKPELGAKAILQSGHLLEFQKGSRVLVPKMLNILPYITWWQDHIILQETPFEEIVQRLRETYGVHIIVKDKRLLKRTLSGSIENRNLEVITEALAQALRVPMKRNGQNIIFGQ